MNTTQHFRSVVKVTAVKMGFFFLDDESLLSPVADGESLPWSDRGLCDRGDTVIFGSVRSSRNANLCLSGEK